MSFSVVERSLVITPSGERARVVRTDGRSAVLRYIDALPGAEAEFSLPVRLLAPVVHGMADPKPVRVQVR